MIDTNKYQTKLNEQLVTLKTDLSSIATYDESNDNWEAVPEIESLGEADSNAEADATEEWNERRSTVESLEIEYRDIKRALAKITAGTFGICEVSGKPIEEKRLDVKATARTCVAHMDEESNLPL